MAHFRVTTKKSFGAAQRGSTWVNTYIINTTEVLSSPAMVSLANAIVDFEKGFHQTATQFISVTVAALEGATSGTPQGTRTIPSGGNGSRVSADVSSENGVFHKEMVLYVKFATEEGESGAKAYRGALAEDFVSWNSGVGTVNQTIQDAINNGWTALDVALGDTKLAVEHKANKVRTGFSDVTAIAIQGIRSRQTTRRKKKGTEATDSNGLIGLLQDNAVSIGLTLAALVLTRGRSGAGALSSAAPTATPVIAGMKSTLDEMLDMLSKATTTTP